MQQVATGYGLIEDPVWDPAHGLYFSDVLNGGVFLLDRAGKVSQVVPKRRGIGGMALHEKGGLVAGGRDIAHISLDGGVPKTLLALDAIPGATGFNDLTTDQAGPHLCRLARLQGVRRRAAKARLPARDRPRRHYAYPVGRHPAH